MSLVLGFLIPLPISRSAFHDSQDPYSPKLSYGKMLRKWLNVSRIARDYGFAFGGGHIPNMLPVYMEIASIVYQLSRHSEIQQKSENTARVR